jgi:lysophospholipase L1-like esterase
MLAMAVAAAALAGGSPAVTTSASQKKAPAKKVAARKAGTKTAAKRKAAPARRRRVLRPPPSTPRQRAEAATLVTRTLAAAEQGAPVHVLHFGDSHTASDSWTGSVRALLQGQFGDGGGGFSLAGHPFAGYRRMDLRGAASRGWQTEGLLAREGDGMWGLGGVSISTTRADEWVSLEADCQHLELYFLRQPGGGDFELSDGDETVATVSTDGELGPGFVEYDALPGLHRFQVRTVHGAPVRLFGWVTDKERGITYESLGINGAQASVILKWDEALLASHVARRNPALIVLAYGTNEAGNPEWTGASYREMFSALLARLRRAAPAASILVLGPPDRYRKVRGRWTPMARIVTIVEAQRRAALANGCAFWDLRDKMGGPGAMRNWVLAGLAQYDHVHFTAPGYRRLGYILFRDLMYNYEKYTQVRGELAGRSGPRPGAGEIPQPITNGPTSADR